MDSYSRIRQALIPQVDFHQNHYARTLSRVLGDQPVWLDLGAGAQVHNGYGVPSTNELTARAGAVIGLDPVVDHLGGNKRLSYAVGGIGDALPFASDSFDLVTANMVIEHLDNPLRVFGEVLRVLKPDGRFVFVTPNLNHPVIRTASLLLSKRVRTLLATIVEQRAEEHVFPTYYRANTCSTLKRLAAEVGFVIDDLNVHRNIPFFQRPTPILVVEAAFIRATEWKPLNGLGADIVGVFRCAKHAS